MSKLITFIPLQHIKHMAILPGSGRELADIKGDADYIINGGFYSMVTGKPTNHLKVDGTVLAKEEWNCWGYTWDDGSDIRMDVIPDKGGRNYLSAVELVSPMITPGKAPQYPTEVGGYRPRSAMALTVDKLILYCTNEGTTPEQLQEELLGLGVESAIMLDSGGSSQCDFLGETITSTRRVHNYIAVWLTEEGKKALDRKRVVLDPGHGVETEGKRSPDGKYLEHEFNLDVAKRVAAHLERHDVEAILTRNTEHEIFPGDDNADLSARVKISNMVKPALFVSIHSNAYGDGTEWTDPAGYLIYTSAAGDTAGRNIAAKAILARAKAAGIQIHGDGLQHNLYFVLRYTNDPAVLIEHGFHTNIHEVELLKNSAYRDLLAKVDAQGILDYLGIVWKEEPAESVKTGCVCPWCGKPIFVEKGE